MSEGYIKLHRKLLDNPIITKDSDHLAIWIHILISATYKDHDIMFNKERYTLKPGEFSTGRKQLAKQFKISESKVERVLKLFESCGQIEQRTDRQCRIIKVIKWSEYQNSDNEGTTSEQRVNTKQERKEYKEDIIINNNIIDKSINNSKELVVKTDNRNQDINEMQEFIKNTVSEFGLLYKPGKYERERIKNILTAKEFGKICETLNASKKQFIYLIIKYSIEIKFWKKINNAELFYTHYADVYNEIKGRIKNTTVIC